MPFGLPVVPEVYRTYSGCSASNGSGVVLGRLPVDDVVPPDVAALGPVDVLAGPADDEHVPHVAGSSRSASSTAGLSAAAAPRR